VATLTGVAGPSKTAAQTTAFNNGNKHWLACLPLTNGNNGPVNLWTWAMDHKLFWNEQYLLRAFMTFNSRFRFQLEITVGSYSAAAARPARSAQRARQTSLTQTTPAAVPLLPFVSASMPTNVISSA
jgi:hypothetical protein